MIKVGDKVKVQGSNKRHCCYGMVGVISCIVPEERRPKGYYGSRACVVFDDRKDEFGDSRDYHWCDQDILVLTDEPCTVMADPLDRIRGLFS